MKKFIQNQPVLKTLIKALPAVLNKFFQWSLQFVSWCVMHDLWLTSEKIYSKPACSENTDQTSTSRVE